MTEKLSKRRLAIIGAGNMGSAILKGILDSCFLDASDISIFDKDLKKTEIFKDIENICILKSIEEALINSEYILLAVKPQQINDVLKNLKNIYPSSRNIIISIAAGITTKFFEDRIGCSPSVIRIMPNAPSIYLKGMSVISKGRFTEEKHLEFAEKLMKSVGEVMIIDEEMQNLATIISGSGPAYFYTFCKLITEFAVKKGLDEKSAKKLIVETMIGAGAVLQNSGHSFQSLISAVASPGGTTEKALESFQIKELSEIFDYALENALNRAYELGKNNKPD